MSTVVATTTLRNNLSEAINELAGGKNYLLVARRGKVNSALVNIDFFEDLMALTSKKYLTSIKQAREEYSKGEIFDHDKAWGQI